MTDSDDFFYTKAELNKLITRFLKETLKTEGITQEKLSSFLCLNVSEILKNGISDDIYGFYLLFTKFPLFFSQMHMRDKRWHEITFERYDTEMFIINTLAFLPELKLKEIKNAIKEYHSAFTKAAGYDFSVMD
ncbi:MAG: hypothetical protein IJ870_04480 [Alphaproteobacteria bacterium]|nr:hypothetical protein [Alphaproteobacteria bacterium]